MPRFWLRGADVTGPFVDGTDARATRALFEKPKQLDVPRAPQTPILDGVADDEMWRAAAQIDQFYLLGGERLPMAGTRAKMFYDDKNLYVTLWCAEPGRKKPLIKHGPIWGDDAVEIWIDTNGDGKTYHQLIVNAAGGKLELTEAGVTPWAVHVAVAVDQGRGWSIEAAIPFASLGVATPKPGDSWRLNLARHRPRGEKFNTELSTWGPLERSFKELSRFGTVTFR